ncbi:prepilin-type N-terminal cleavage/methylation domain-containing protein [Algisphaera agarilytica]|uniref:Type II secretion system protein J n=1 Tax=Algisphaera agarilytica TaxID=1385975 RepID=A0A7X0H5Y4_9BACT|nr:prepilin-type N-terminal cleavage/methylation domain-containing protein [Algisphaera agarilytica]MBB6429897.1 prepilin-type N-terminal cleavage/methylation domain-containing protein [Algisphaera agarilytica]
MRSPAFHRSSGFTLIELLVAASLVGIVLAAGATLTYQVSQARGKVDQLARHHAEADAAIRTIATALTQQFRNTGDDDRVFVGIDDEVDGRPADSIRFFAVSNRVIRPGEPESDVHEIEFYLEPQDGEPYPALLRRTDPTRNEEPDEGGVIELVARGIGGLDFEYFDGQQWLPDWPEFLGSSPMALRVTVGVTLNDEAGTMRPYRRLIYFPMMPQPGQGGGANGGGSGSGNGNGGFR